MKIHGLNKLTLLDFPGHTACTLFTGGCNFCCPFCHNASLVLPGEAPEALPEKQVLDFLYKRRGILEGICITGGEPTLQPDLPYFIREVKKMGYLIKLDTNGSHPKQLIQLIEENLLDYVAMDIKNEPSRYPLSTGLLNVNTEEIKKSACYLMSAQIACEFRTTVIKEHHDDQAFHIIGAWLNGASAYYLQAFENSGNLIQDGLHQASKQEMLSYREILLPHIKVVKLRGI